MKFQMKTVLAASVLALTTTAAYAQDRPRVNLNQPQAQTPGISYTYAGVRYMFQNLDNYDCDQDGLNIYGSLDIQDGFYAKASFSDVDGDVCGSRSFIAGGGYHTAFSDTTDMYATVSFGSISADGGGDDSGLELAGGLRSYLKEQVEGNVELFHNTIGDSETGIRGGLLYWFNGEFAASADLGLSADSTTFAIGARMAF